MADVAMVRRMADTISFARGAPSLDIVDVEGLQAAAAARSSTTRAGRPPTARRSATCRCASGSPTKHGVDASQVLVTNGSMQADAFLFDDARQRTATRSSSSARPTTARC